MRRLHGARDGGAVATEFALLMAFMPLPFLAFGIVDYGEVMAQATNLIAIVRGAAEYARGAVVEGGISALPTGSAVASQLNTGATLTTASFCTCAGSADTTIQQNYMPVPCGGNPCAATPGGDTRVLKYVAVSGSQSYTPIVSGTWNFPGSVNARTVLRTQ